MYDIILVNLNAIAFNKRENCNQGLASIEAYLKSQGVACLVINYHELDQYINLSSVFGFSVLDYNYSIAATLTQKLSNKTVIWGGWTPSAIPERILQNNPNVDYIILGEGEKRLEHLLLSFQLPMLFPALDGVAYRDKKNKINIRPAQTYLDLDTLPIPSSLTILNDMVFVELSRGCYGNCGYCQETSKMRFKNPGRLADELESWLLQGYNNFHIGNANSLANGRLLRQLLQEIESRDLFLRAALVGRPDDVLRNQKILERLFQSPNIEINYIEMGVETNSQHLLDLLRRKTTPEMNRQAVQLLLGLKKKYSVSTNIHTNIILFSHYDMTLDDLAENIKFMGEFKTCRDTLSLYLYGLADTPIWYDMLKRNFSVQEKYGFQITEYPFSDPYVDQLYQKIVASPLKTFNRGFKHSRYDLQNLQHSCHDIMLEFYYSNNIHQAIFDFLEHKEAKEIKS